MKPIEKRINRIIGQLKGIEKMAQNKRTSEEIIQQISAVKKAIDGLTKELVEVELQKNLSEDQSKHIIKLIDQAIRL